MLFLTPIRMNFGEIIYEKGQFPHSVYFIIGGNISYVAGSQSMTYKTMVSGGYFGEIEIFKEIAR